MPLHRVSPVTPSGTGPRDVWSFDTSTRSRRGLAHRRSTHLQHTCELGRNIDPLELERRVCTVSPNLCVYLLAKCEESEKRGCLIELIETYIFGNPKVEEAGGLRNG